MSCQKCDVKDVSSNNIIKMVNVRLKSMFKCLIQWDSFNGKMR